MPGMGAVGEDEAQVLNRKVARAAEVSLRSL